MRQMHDKMELNELRLGCLSYERSNHLETSRCVVARFFVRGEHVASLNGFHVVLIDYRITSRRYADEMALSCR